jgi:hypothetical protein
MPVSSPHVRCPYERRTDGADHANPYSNVLGVKGASATVITCLGHAWGTGARKMLVTVVKYQQTYPQLRVLLAEQSRMEPWSGLQASSSALSLFAVGAGQRLHGVEQRPHRFWGVVAC